VFASSRGRRRGRAGADYWPGFVDVLSTLLLVMIFMLVVYMLAQYFLQRTLSGQTEALEELSLQVGELAEMLSLERQANADLRLNIAQLSAQLQTSIAVRDQLSDELSLALSERNTLQLRLREMTGEAQAALAEAAEAKQAEADALVRAEAGEEQIKVLLSDVEQVRRDIEALQTVRADLEAKVTELSAALETSESEKASANEALTALRDTTAELEARLSTEQERTALAQRELEDREIRLAELQELYLQTQNTLTESEAALTETRDLSDTQRDQIDLLNQQIAALRSQLGRIEEALETSERRTEEQEVTIADLGRRLNLALAAKVEELAAYRSEFFGRLRQVLDDQRDFTIIGDRFVFQSEVLFGSGSEELGGAGRERLAQFASILKEVMERIPADLPWILQVDGHTDRRPIQTARFPSNWELSSARAISVVNFLIDQGIPAFRLSATGYGEFQPIDEREDEIAYRRNRRIELKMTQR
jgi:chemotaxis protein MotB